MWQYPGEKEITFPPYTCLESDGDARLERDAKGNEVVIFPLKVPATQLPLLERLQHCHTSRRASRLLVLLFPGDCWQGKRAAACPVQTINSWGWSRGANLRRPACVPLRGFWP